MLELSTYNQESIRLQKVLNTKQRITIDLIRDGKEFLEQFNINQELVLDTVAIIYQYLKKSGKIPQNLYKFFIAAYYIISRHPVAFPMHEPKKDFCQIFGLQISSLDYTVEKIVATLNYIKIIDDMNFPYFMNPHNDLGLDATRSMVKDKVESAMMNFLIYNQPINAQILSEELITKIIFEMKVFPEELFRQFFELVNDFVEYELRNYKEIDHYARMQEKYFI